MTGIELIPPLVELGLKIVDYFRKRGGDRDAIRKLDRHTVGEHVSGRLVAMHDALAKAEAELDVYLKLLALSSGQPKEIFVQNYNQFFVSRVEDYLKIFWKNLEDLEKITPKVLESVKGYACGAEDQYGNDLEQQLQHYAQIQQSVGRFTAFDITNLIDKYQKFIDCYLRGVAGALEDLPHAQ